MKNSTVHRLNEVNNVESFKFVSFFAQMSWKVSENGIRCDVHCIAGIWDACTFMLYWRSRILKE